MTKHFNGLTEAQAERLALLAEECAEVIQAITKILRHGMDSYNPLIDAMGEYKNRVTNQMLLEKELGHVLCAQRFLWHASDVRKHEVDRHAEEKEAKIGRWLHHQS